MRRRKATKEEREAARVWLAENYPYIISCTRKFFRFYKWFPYKRRYYPDALAVAVECVLENHWKYKVGPRSLRSWIYRTVTFYLRNFMNRKVIPYEKNAVRDMIDWPITERYFITEDFYPSIEAKEEATGYSIWGHKIE